MSKFIKGIGKIKMQEGGLAAPDMPQQVSQETAAGIKESNAAFMKSLTFKLNAAAICVVIGIVVYHLGALLSGQNVTARQLKEQRQEIIALSQGLNAARLHSQVQDEKMNAMVDAMRRDVRQMSSAIAAQIDESNKASDERHKKIVSDAGRMKLSILDLKKENVALEESIRKLTKKVEGLQAPVVQQ